MPKPIFIIDITKEPYVPVPNHQYEVPQDSTGCAICGMHEEWHRKPPKKQLHQESTEPTSTSTD